MSDEQTPALRQAVENMVTMREAYDNLSQAAEAYNTGKAELAANITSKGVQASATETLPELAEKVSAITQESYTIDGGEMYAKQLFGSLETPNYWNLYDILANLLSDGRLVSYGGILLAEYYRGYDSLALAGAGAGGAYVVSDLDENGQFKMYTEDTMHTWTTEFDGHGNRWVAYCFADEYHDFQITDTNTSPRSIFIGRKVGTISQLVASRISQIVVPDGNELRDFSPSYKSCNYGSHYVLRNIGRCNSDKCIDSSVIELIYFQFEELGSARLTGNYDSGSSMANLSSFILDCKRITGTSGMIGQAANTTYVVIKNVEKCTGTLHLGTFRRNYSVYGTYSKLTEIDIIDTEQLDFRIYPESGDALPVLKTIKIGYKSNDRTKGILISGTAASRVLINDVQLKEGWCKPLNVSFLDKLTEENIVNHILNRLGDNTGQSPLTITLGATNLAKLTAEEIAIATNKGFTLA